MATQFTKEYRIDNELSSADKTTLTLKTWAVGVSFTADDDYVAGSDGLYYRAKTSHTATSGDEPGVGATQADEWYVIPEKNSHYYIPDGNGNFDHYVTGTDDPPTVYHGARALGVNSITVSTSDPSGGEDGDVWIKVSA